MKNFKNSGTWNKYKLTEREMEVLSLVVQAKTNIEIAQELEISTHTAKFYVSSILDKMSARSRVSLAVKAVMEEMV